MSELKNCPFCGSTAVHIKNNMGVNYITCSNTYEQSKGDCVYDLRVNPKDWSRRSVEAEITALKEELKREREAVDFYANIKNYADNTGYQSPPESTIIDWRLGDNETVEGHWYGGKKARETQRKRRILS